MAFRKEQPISYQAFLDMEWGENERVELIDGRIYMMSVPSLRHQIVLGNLHGQLYSYLHGKKCKALISPLAVRLNNDTEVQPDLVVVCDLQKLINRGCNGAPDLVVEILSRSTSMHDRHTKFMLYMEAGVPEYWIVDPIITAFRLTDRGYIATRFTEVDTATIDSLPDFEMDLAAVFEE